MDTATITSFIAELDKATSNSRTGNARSAIFARRAKDIVVTAYGMDWQTKVWKARDGVDTAKADKLIGMGATEAIYGRGRFLLEK